VSLRADQAEQTQGNVESIALAKSKQKHPSAVWTVKLSQFIMLRHLTCPGSSAREPEWQDIPVTFMRKASKWRIWHEMERHNRAGFLPSLWNNAYLNQCQWTL